VNPDDFRSLAGHVSLLDGQRPERLAEVHERVVVARRRRAITAAVGTAGVVLAVLAGVASYSMRDEAGPGPVKDPEPTAVNRSLVYAEGSTIHYGDQTYDAGRAVEFVEATDDGFVYITEDSHRLWFTNGSRGASRIGLVAPGHVGEYPVLTGNPGSLVAFEYAPTPRAQREIVVYDSHRGQIVTSPEGDALVAVNGDRVYWRRAGDLMRFDQSEGTEEAVSSGALRTDLASNPRMLVIDRPWGDLDLRAETGQRLAFFKLVGRQLVATDSISRGVDGNTTQPTMLADGRPLRLTVPQRYGGTEEALAVVQWLDDHHVVLFAYHEHNELPRHVGDFLACRVPTGTCRVVVLASETPYVPPGDVP